MAHHHDGAPIEGIGFPIPGGLDLLTIIVNLAKKVGIPKVQDRLTQEQIDVQVKAGEGKAKPVGTEFPLGTTGAHARQMALQTFARKTGDKA